MVIVRLDELEVGYDALCDPSDNFRICTLET